MAKNITLYNNLQETTTSVPNRFIDHYMISANGEYVKIYLYLLRCMNQPECTFSLSRLADHFDHTEKDIQRALKYWEKVKLLKLEYDSQNNLSGICLMPITPSGHQKDPANGRSQKAVPPPGMI